MRLVFLIIAIVWISNLSAQKNNHNAKFKLGATGPQIEFSFVDEAEKKYQEDEFTKFIIFNGAKKLMEENADIWIPMDTLYTIADTSVNNRIGLFYSHDTTYLWLTNKPHTCDLHKTTIYSYRNNSITKVFEKEFNAISLVTFNGGRYLTGVSATAEPFDKINIGYVLSTYCPEEYYSIDRGFILDSALTNKKNTDKYTLMVDWVDVFDAGLISVTFSDIKILIPNELRLGLEDREYGIVSITKFTKEFLNSLTKEQLKIMKNEIFAYNGYIFNTQELFDYFSKFAWYQPTVNNSDGLDDKLSDIEKYNLELIKVAESGK